MPYQITNLSTTRHIEIYIAGSLEQIKQVCQEFCERGFCVNVSPTEFIYTGGRETGACVQLINYPKFEEPLLELEDKAYQLAGLLLECLRQRSCTIQTPDVSRRLERLATEPSAVEVICGTQSSPERLSPAQGCAIPSEGVEPW